MMSEKAVQNVMEYYATQEAATLNRMYQALQKKTFLDLVEAVPDTGLCVWMNALYGTCNGGGDSPYLGIPGDFRFDYRSGDFRYPLCLTTISGLNVLEKGREGVCVL